MWLLDQPLNRGMIPIELTPWQCGWLRKSHENEESEWRKLMEAQVDQFRGLTLRVWLHFNVVSLLLPLIENPPLWSRATYVNSETPVHWTSLTVPPANHFILVPASIWWLLQEPLLYSCCSIDWTTLCCIALYGIGSSRAPSRCGL